MLPTKLSLPHDIPRLVQDVYNYEVTISPEPDGYQKAKENWIKKVGDKEKRAGDFRVTQPWDSPRENMVNWLNTDVSDISDQQGEAAVRDTDESIEILLIQEKKGGLFFLPWMEGGRKLPEDKEIDDETAKAIARQRVHLPHVLCAPWAINQTADELKEITEKRLSYWQKSSWLKGELVLILNEDQEALLCGYRLKYNREDGLTYEKEGEENA